MEESCDHVNSSEGCNCSSKPSSYAQSLTEMDFERGIWQAALDGNMDRVRSLLDKEETLMREMAPDIQHCIMQVVAVIKMSASCYLSKVQMGMHKPDQAK
ncbi:Ankyrin repeat domain-containing protein 39 [Desmophyllum pertusum]|uniref:Ankyrin repeat domain-containing protein 39 n=1 Tax=Desmophyllum pertusum TaxID=174260 RepID=A0A9W9YUW2_9CNID|nr:Ankyrin repeat domain-containing protein 39 [Desmophyllum pertusum]